jgi:hypothetical protein
MTPGPKYYEVVPVAKTISDAKIVRAGQGITKPLKAGLQVMTRSGSIITALDAKTKKNRSFVHESHIIVVRA